jgi:predicted CoA-binding protein
MRTIEQILRTASNVAVVGLSSNPERTSHHVAAYLQGQGYHIIPVNPVYAGQQILGETVHATLQDAADALAQNGQRIDVVDCFRKPEDIPPIAKDAIAVRAGTLWMQLDIENRKAADLARAAGLDVVMNHCMLIEHRKLGTQDQGAA